MRADIKLVCERALMRYGKGSAGKRWDRIIENLSIELFAEYPQKAIFVEEKYFKNKTKEQICESFPMSGVTFRLWREDVLARLAAKAAFEGLITP